MYQKPKENKTSDFSHQSMSHPHPNVIFLYSEGPSLQITNLSVRHQLNIQILAKHIVTNILPIKVMTVQNESDSSILLYATYLFTEVAL
jgi:hypothetical protein